MAYRTPSGRALRQGDLLTNVRTFCLTDLQDPDHPVGRVLEYTYSIVVTQDCDLEQDFAARFPTDERDNSPDKLLFGILLCGVHGEARLKAGQHRERAKQFGKAEWKAVVKNQDPRYQYLGLVPGADTRLVVDFKDFFMAPCDFLYRELKAGRIQRAVEMDSPYKEHLLQRFAWYLMRVGLPKDFDQLAATTPAAPEHPPAPSPAAAEDPVQPAADAGEEPPTAAPPPPPAPPEPEPRKE